MQYYTGCSLRRLLVGQLSPLSLPALYSTSLVCPVGATALLSVLSTNNFFPEDLFVIPVSDATHYTAPTPLVPWTNWTNPVPLPLAAVGLSLPTHLSNPDSSVAVTGSDPISLSGVETVLPEASTGPLAAASPPTVMLTDSTMPMPGPPAALHADGDPAQPGATPPHTPLTPPAESPLPATPPAATIAGDDVPINVGVHDNAITSISAM